MSAPPIRVLLVEDNQVFREALELLLGLRDDIDVVVMDYRLPGLDGVEATKAVLAAFPATAVVVLTASANVREMDALQQAGAVACLTKDQDLDEIVGAILRAAA